MMTELFQNYAEVHHKATIAWAGATVLLSMSEESRDPLYLTHLPSTPCWLKYKSTTQEQEWFDNGYKSIITLHLYHNRTI